MKRPVVTSVLGASGVIIGHTGWAPGRKCDPAALGLCVAQRLPSGTSVTAPIQLQNNFCCAFFCFNCLRPFMSEQRHSPIHLAFLQMLFGNCATGQRMVFFLVVFVLAGKSHHESLMQLVFTSFWKHFHERFARFSHSRVPEMWCFRFYSSE